MRCSGLKLPKLPSFFCKLLSFQNGICGRGSCTWVIGIVQGRSSCQSIANTSASPFLLQNTNIQPCCGDTLDAKLWHCAVTDQANCMQWLIHMTLHEVTLEYEKYSKAKPQQFKVAASDINSTRVHCIAWFLGDKPPSREIAIFAFKKQLVKVDAFSVHKTGDALCWYLVPVELGHMLFLSLTCDASISRDTFDSFCCYGIERFSEAAH